MIKRVFKSIEALSSEKLISELSENELKGIYTFMQVIRILTSITWMSSFIICYFIALLLNSQSSLIDWSRSHIYLVVFMFVIFLLMPVFTLFSLSSSLAPIASSLYKSRSLQAPSPRKIWIFQSFIGLLMIALIAFISSFVELYNEAIG
jgi:hypothetical protein